MIPYRLYFILRRDTNEVKVGISKDVQRRMKDLQMANGAPLELLGSTPGGSDEESAVHDAFVDCRKYGEWFHATPEMMAFIARVLLPYSPHVAKYKYDHPARHIDECLLEHEAGELQSHGGSSSLSHLSAGK